MDENADITAINNGQKNCGGVLFLGCTAVVLLVRFLGIQEDVVFFHTEILCIVRYKLAFFNNESHATNEIILSCKRG